MNPTILAIYILIGLMAVGTTFSQGQVTTTSIKEGATTTSSTSSSTSISTTTTGSSTSVSTTSTSVTTTTSITPKILRTANTDRRCTKNGCYKVIYGGVMNMLNSEREYEPFTKVVSYTQAGDDYTFTWHNGTFTIKRFYIINGQEVPSGKFGQDNPSASQSSIILNEGGSYEIVYYTNNIPRDTMNSIDSIGFRITDHNFDKKDIGKDRKQGVFRNNVAVNFQNAKDKDGLIPNMVNATYTLIPITDKGGNSIRVDPTIKLNLTNKGILDDTYAYEFNPTTNFGAINFFYTQNTTQVPSLTKDMYSLMKFNITGLPSGIIVTSSVVSLYLAAITAGANTNVSILQLDNQTWVELEPTWDHPVKGAGSVISWTAMATAGQRYQLDVSSWVINQHLANKPNVSFRIMNMPVQLSDIERFQAFSSSEATTPSEAPYINITYVLKNPPKLNIRGSGWLRIRGLGRLIIRSG